MQFIAIRARQRFVNQEIYRRRLSHRAPSEFYPAFYAAWRFQHRQLELGEATLATVRPLRRACLLRLTILPRRCFEKSPGGGAEFSQFLREWQARREFGNDVAQ